MCPITSFTGQVEELDEKLILRVPLREGGTELKDCCEGISEIRGDYLFIEIRDWAAQMLEIRAGSFVAIHNENRTFNIRLEIES